MDRNLLSLFVKILCAFANPTAVRVSYQFNHIVLKIKRKKNLLQHQKIIEKTECLPMSKEDMSWVIHICKIP